MTAPIAGARAHTAKKRSLPTSALVLALGLFASSCIDSMSVGVSPLAAVDASDTGEREAGTGNSGVRDAGKRADSGSTTSEAGLVDAAPPDAAVRDAAVRDAGTDSAHDAGLERCDETFCQIAGVAPVDDTCPKGQSSACLRETSGQCTWQCL